jgi:hypothetical protein
VRGNTAAHGVVANAWTAADDTGYAPSRRFVEDDMTTFRALVGLVLILGGASALAGGTDGGAGNDPCDGGPLETRSVLRCRDGDPRCDMDGACDGTCFVKTCIVPPANPSSCLVTSRLCPRSKAIGYLDQDDGPWLIPVGERRTFRYHATLVGAACKPARRRCVPPTPPPCLVTIAGDRATSFACQARLIAVTPDRAMPFYYQIFATERGGPSLLRILVQRGPSAGRFTADAPDHVVLAVSIRTPDGVYVAADNVDPPRLGSLDATLVLTDVGASLTQYHDAHGALAAKAIGIPGNDPSARVAFTVHANF